MIGQGHSAEISQDDGLAQNILITEVQGGDQQVGHDLGSAVLTNSYYPSILLLSPRNMITDERYYFYVLHYDY